MKKERTFISFDWVLKRLLRDKANFDVLEGFASTLSGRTIKIHKLLESDGKKIATMQRRTVLTLT